MVVVAVCGNAVVVFVDADTDAVINKERKHDYIEATTLTKPIPFKQERPEKTGI